MVISTIIRDRIYRNILCILPSFINYPFINVFSHRKRIFLSFHALFLYVFFITFDIDYTKDLGEYFQQYEERDRTAILQEEGEWKQEAACVGKMDYILFFIAYVFILFDT